MKLTPLFSLALACFVPAAIAQNPAAPTAADRLGWELTVHSYTFKEFSIFEAIDKTAALGVKYMSLSGSVSLDGTNKISTIELSEKDQQAIKAKLQAAGIVKIVNMGVVQLPPDEAKSRRVFAFAKKFGIDTLVAEPEPAALDLVEKLCKEYNIRVAIHDHPKPSRYWNPDTVAAAIQGRSPLLGDCADVGHWIRSGLNPLACLQKLDGRIFCLHFKDLNEPGMKAHDVPWGTGVGQTKALLAEMQRQNFHGAFCVEYEYHWTNSSPEIAECVKFFNAECEHLAAAPAK